MALGKGFVLPWVQLSQMLLAIWLPMAARTCVSSPGQSSRSRERTRERWVPRFLWIPEHSMQISAPRLRLAQVGSKQWQWRTEEDMIEGLRVRKRS